jgi:hypothetical protein
MNQGKDHPTQPPPQNTSTKIFLHLEFHPEDPNPRLFITSGKSMSLNQKEHASFEICATFSKRRSTLTDSQLPTVDHLICGIGFLCAISLVGDETSLVTWSSSYSFLVPFIFRWLAVMPLASHGQPTENNLTHPSHSQSHLSHSYPWRA